MDAAGTIFGVMVNVQDPRTLADKLLNSMTASQEKAVERTAVAAERTAAASEATAEHARRQAMIAELALRDRLKQQGMDDEQIDEYISTHVP